MKLILILLYLSLSSIGLSQDERFIRKEVIRQSKLKKVFKEKKEAKWSLWSKHYLLDLNQDGYKERIQFNQRDGTDYIVVYEDDLSKVFEAPMKTWIGGGRPYKLRLVNLDKQVMCLIIYYYEGNFDIIRTQTSSRLYFLTIDRKDLNKMYLQRGPQILDETKNLNGHYHVRNYKVKVIDFNDDGHKSIGIFYGLTSKIYEYHGKGKWVLL